MFTSTESGGSLLVAWQLKGRNVLVIGGGLVAAGRIANALNADGQITLVCPRSNLSPEVRYRVDKGEVGTYHDREFVIEDIIGMDMVLAAVDLPEVSSTIWKACQAARIPVNVADVPSKCDFYFGSQYRDGPLQVMVSTSGNAPRLTRLVKRMIEDALPHNIGQAVANVGKLRSKLKLQAPLKMQSEQRMRWMSRVCDEWSITDLSMMDDMVITKILQLGFDQGGRVPDFTECNWQRPTLYCFDGSMGFAV